MKKLFFVVFLLTSTVILAGDLYVSPFGSDSNSGTKEKPFASIQKARDTIRISDKSVPWTVHLSAGHFEVTEPIRFEAIDSGSEDAPITYSGTEPIRFEAVDSGSEDASITHSGVAGITFISGGKKIEGWKQSGTGVWVADIPKTNGKPDYFEQMFVNGNRAVRARHPNTGFFSPKTIQQDTPITREAMDAPNTAQRITAKQGEIANVLKDVPPEELKYAHLVIHHHWDTSRRIPLAFDSATDTLLTQGHPMKFWNPWRDTSLFYLENLRKAFDEPGEWLYDGNAGKVFYRPLEGETLQNTAFFIPRPGLSKLLVAEKGVSFLRFKNICFVFTDTPRDQKLMARAALPLEITGDLNFPGPSQFEPQQAAFYTEAVIDMDGVSNIVLERCDVKHIGEYAIRLQNAKNCRIENCQLFDLGAGAIRLGHNSSNNVVHNCVVRKAGRFHASAVGIWIGQNSSDNQITHNDISDLFYTGISVGWDWGYNGSSFRNLVEYNKVYNIGQNAMADMGGIYTLGKSHGTRIANNVFYNIKSYAYGGWGLYTDEGSEGIVLENNLVYDTTDGSFHQHYGKENIIRNNILCFSQIHQIAATRKEEHLSFTFERNIVYYDRGKNLGSNAASVNAKWLSNLWYNAKGPVDFNGKTHEEWQAAGNDIGGLVADPLFVDAEKRNFILKPNSPAEKIGFVPFDFSKAGNISNK